MQCTINHTNTTSCKNNTNEDTLSGLNIKPSISFENADFGTSSDNFGLCCTASTADTVCKLIEEEKQINEKININHTAYSSNSHTSKYQGTKTAVMPCDKLQQSHIIHLHRAYTILRNAIIK